MDWCRLDVSEELGLYAATELWLEPGRYVAIQSLLATSNPKLVEEDLANVTTTISDQLNADLTSPVLE